MKLTPALLLMDGIAALTGTGGAVLLVRGRHAPGTPATYIRRLSGSILLAFGLILFAFSTAYAVATH